MAEFTPNYIRQGLKTKGDAFAKMIEMMINNPGCAGLDGTCAITVLGNVYELKPKKKRKEQEI